MRPPTTNCHRLMALNNRNLLLYSSRVWNGFIPRTKQYPTTNTGSGVGVAEIPRHVYYYVTEFSSMSWPGGFPESRKDVQSVDSNGCYKNGFQTAVPHSTPGRTTPYQECLLLKCLRSKLGFRKDKGQASA